MDNVTLAQKVAARLFHQPDSTITEAIEYLYAGALLDEYFMKALRLVVGEVLEAVIAEGYHFVKTRETGSFNREVKSG